MTNRIDFYIQNQDILALPAACVAVYLDGRHNCFLEPVEIIRSGWPEFGAAKLRYRLSSQAGDVVPVERIEEMIGFGKTLGIRTFYNAGSPDNRLDGYPIFTGQIENIRMHLGGDKQVVEITARDSSAVLRRKIVYGRRVERQDGSVFMPGFRTIFNPEGQPNASIATINNTGRNYRGFCHADGAGMAFSLAEVIYYLLLEYVPAGIMVIPPIELLETLTKGAIVNNLDVTGMDIIEALHCCCRGTLLDFYFEPVCDGDSDSCAIVFNTSSQAGKIRLCMQQQGQIISITKTSATRIISDKSYNPVTNCYIAMGEYKVFESTFNLVKAWDDSLADDNYQLFCPSSNPDFIRVRDVYRCWSLNETGWYSSSPYNRGQAYDFTRVFDGDAYVTKPRRFLLCLSCDGQGESLGYYLEVSCDAGQTWHQYQGKYDVLTNQCAVRFSDDRLDEDIFAAAIANLLRVRITAAVASDRKLTASCTDGPVESTVPVREHIINLAGPYQYHKVCRTSIFYGTEAGNAGLVDDTQLLYSALSDAAARNMQIVEKMEITTPFLEIGYKFGDIVDASTDGRDIFDKYRQNTITARVERVRMDFDNQCTEICILREKNVFM
jgi:hypothetical protein